MAVCWQWCQVRRLLSYSHLPLLHLRSGVPSQGLTQFLFFFFSGPGPCELLSYRDATDKVPTIDSLSMVHFKCLLNACFQLNQLSTEWNNCSILEYMYTFFSFQFQLKWILIHPYRNANLTLPTPAQIYNLNFMFEIYN